MMKGISITFAVNVGCALLILSLLVLFLAPINAAAEYYSYEDQGGTVHFVEDLSKIPSKYQKKTRVRKDVYDDLSTDDRALLLERERRKRTEDHRLESEQQEQARVRREEENRRVAEARLTTKVLISDGQVFVPVKLGYGSQEIEVMLLLDTGATSSLITPEVAERLNIIETERVRVGVVGGRVINAGKVVLSHIAVGPIRKASQAVVIVQQHPAQFGDGLLGMSFLGGLKYTIDSEKQTITWIP